MKNKTPFFLVLILLASLLLSACSGQANTSSANGTPQAGQGFDPNASLPLATQLAVGTLKLEGTDQAVTAEQAAELVTLWQAYQSLSTSETAAPVELEAVIQQIQDTLTPEQNQAIEAMQLTRQSMNEVMQSLGIDLGGRAAAGTPDPQRTPQAGGRTFQGDGGGPGGGMPGGGVPPDGGAGGGGFGPGGGFSGSTPDASTQATMQARFSTQASRVSPMLLQALIEMLQSK